MTPKKTTIEELEKFLKTLNIHNKDLNICFHDHLAARHIRDFIYQAYELGRKEYKDLGVENFAKMAEKIFINAMEKYKDTNKKEENYWETCGREAREIMGKEEEKEFEECPRCGGAEWSVPEFICVKCHWQHPVGKSSSKKDIVNPKKEHCKDWFKCKTDESILNVKLIQIMWKD